MEASQIPRTFWHALSVAILASTVVLLYIAIRSTNVSIEVANIKINMNTVISENEKLNQELEEQNEAIIEAKKKLIQNYDNFNKMVATFKNSRTIPPEEINKLTLQGIQLDINTISQDRFKNNQEKLIELRKKIE